MSQAACRPIYVPESAHVARTLLSELRGAHGNLIAQMQALDTLCGVAVPDLPSLTTARWKLGQASLARRLLAARICEYFSARCEGPQARALGSLQLADRELLNHSAAHLAQWTTGSICRDWEGYCRAGNEIRRRTYDHIALEQRVLYPLLERGMAQ